MPDILDHDLDDRLLEEFKRRPGQDRYLVAASQLLRPIRNLAKAKWKTRETIVPCDAADVDEEERYQEWRRRFLRMLQHAGLDEHHERSVHLLPRLLVYITRGEVEWNDEAACVLYSELIALSADRGLSKFNEIPNWIVSEYDDVVDEIAERTLERMKIKAFANAHFVPASPLSRIGGGGTWPPLELAVPVSPSDDVPLEPIGVGPKERSSTLADELPLRLLEFTPPPPPVGKSRKGIGGAPPAEVDVEEFAAIWCGMLDGFKRSCSAGMPKEKAPTWKEALVEYNSRASRAKKPVKDLRTVKAAFERAGLAWEPACPNSGTCW